MERKQFGQPIGHFQMNQDMIAEMSTEIEADRLLVYKAAWAKDQGKLNNGLDVAQAKYFAGEVGNQMLHFAMWILGAYGYSTDTRWPVTIGMHRPTAWWKARPTSASGSSPRINWGSARRTGNGFRFCVSGGGYINKLPRQPQKRENRWHRLWV